MGRDAWIAIVGFLVLSGLMLHGLLVDAVSAGEMKYGLWFDWLFFALLLLGLYLSRNKLQQSSMSFGLIVAVMVLHASGAVFWYGSYVLGLQFDMVMHFASGFALYWFSRRLVFADAPVSELPLYGIVSVLVVMGLAAVHELIEFVSYGLAAGGPGLFTSGGDMVLDYVDLNWDLAFGLFGALLGMASDITPFRKLSHSRDK